LESAPRKNRRIFDGQREEFIDFINSCQLSAVSCQLIYDKSVISESRLEQYKVEEVAAKATLVGPHRDDFTICKKEKELSKYGEPWRQRLAVLC
jgi:recombinational DNA repair ATPase RecF